MAEKIAASQVMTNPVNFFAFGFGAGLAPKAPGTFGTLVAIPFVWLTADLSLFYYLALTAVICIVGVYLCHKSAEQLGVHDHPGIVWDEIAGYFITMIGFSFTWTNAIVGFVLFRFFDIIKPWPIRWADKKVSGGFGIMLDDIIAGMFAWVSLFLFNYFGSGL
ncbi:phosphatidylglycerophosphatase A [Aliikangiella marina]|uniref:Phosphatidylglycerophosphatase A n=1 Tax=Aliikangiella marina TaxID=1712262 RepID=A0A545TA48_9GAMM|nr:phosphatidylglycerophosphatase A [Aliikangiella marina]TQV74090.1 phosphatidylglycerophosphatase A [Aliikangiella marina]